MKNATEVIKTVFERGRPLAGGYAVGLSELQHHIEKIIEQIKTLSQNGKVILAIPYHREHEISFIWLLEILAGQIRRETDLTAHLILPQIEPDFSQNLTPRKSFQKESRETFLREIDVLLIHNLPDCPSAIGILEKDERSNQIIVATGAHQQWENINSLIPIVFYLEKISLREGFEVDEVTDIFEKIAANDYREFQNLQTWQKKAFSIVACWDAFGVPLPLDLLAASLDCDDAELDVFIKDDKTQNLFCRFETDFPPGFSVSTKSPLIARILLNKIGEEKSDNYTAVINAVAGENKDERYTALNFFQSALSDSQFFKRSELRNLIETCSHKIEEIYKAGDEIEHLLWGKVFEDLRRFELSGKVFCEGLSKNSENSYLRQAYARMLGKSAETNEEVEQARKVFREAINLNAGNPYFWQAAGVFEATHNPNEARSHFREALAVANGTETKNYILVAWADLEIEEGKFEEAKSLLEQIENGFQTPYIPHIWAKLYFYQGEYEKVAEKLKQVFAVNRYSIEGWNLLGEINAKRARWSAARTALENALAISSENIPTLRALADLETALGRLASEENKTKEAGGHFARAADFLAKALDAEKENLYCQVSRAVLLRYEGKLAKKQGKTEQAEKLFQTAEQNLKQIFEKHPDNEFVSHNLGELYLVWRKVEKAQTYFKFLYERNKKSIPTLVGLAKTEVDLEDREKASDYLDKAEKVLEKTALRNYERIRAYNSLAEVWLWLNDLERAKNLVETALKFDAENGFTLRLYANILQRNAESAEAGKFKAQAEELSLRKLTDFPKET